tara:strand:- start:2876 stop:4504 length:1629 start_codon:yes stop_codon:yes gene_type:complete
MYDPKPIDMTEALRQVYEGKKLDPVGQEDKDIDNDGDHDKSDKYLLNRRKVRGAAIKTRKEEVEEILDSLNEEELDLVLEFIGGKKGDGYIGHPNLDIKNPLAKKQTKGPVGNKTGSGMVHRVGGALGDRKMKMDAMMKGLSKGGEVKGKKYNKEEVVHELAQLDEEQLNELLGGIVGGLMNMGKKGGFMKGATTGIGGLAGQALGKKSGIQGLLGFSKGGEKKKVKKEALAFSEEEELFIEECDFDQFSDEDLIDFFEHLIIEMSEDDDDFVAICEELDICGVIMEEEERDAGAEARERLKKKQPSNMDRLKSAAAEAGRRLKKGAKAVIGAGARAAGHAVGEYQAQRKKSKKAAMERGEDKGETKKSDDGDKTGGKLDDLLSSIRGGDSGGGSSEGGGESGGKKKGPGLLRRIGRTLKKGLKKAVGKTARAIAGGSDKLASRLGESYDDIAHLYESGLFTIKEIEHVIEEGYKEIDKKKENKMYRRAGNLAREGLSAKDKKKKEKALKKSEKIVSAISRQKERERFGKMADIKARDNYEG